MDPLNQANDNIVDVSEADTATMELVSIISSASSFALFGINAGTI